MNFINKTSVISGVSDHQAVTIESKLSLKPKKSVPRVIQLWNKVDINKLKADTKNFSNIFKSSYHNKSVNDMWLCIKNNIQTIINDNVPTKETSKFYQPWITTQTKRLIRNKNLWYQKAKQRNDEKSWKKYKDYKNLAQKLCRKSHDNYVQDLITSDKSNKKLWSYVKSQRKEKTGISDLNVNNKVIQDPKQKADLFNEQFSKVFSDPNQPSESAPKRNVNPNVINNIQVSKNGVLKLLQGINENKATGPDDIPGKFLKICSYELPEIYTILFQTSLNSGTIPDDWKTANIFPLFKKGNKNNVENYRPISLTCISSKLLEHIVHSTTMDFLDSNKILTPFQHGFRQGRSCESQLLTTLNDFTKTLNTSNQTDAVLLDFSKAFDKVDHKILLSKIDNMGIQGPLHDWMSSFLKDRLQFVIVDGSISNPCKVLSGVPQGTVLGPLFFLIYINDIQDNLSPGTFLRLFADDSLLYRVINSINDTIILQKDLDQLQKWEKLNKMEFHPGKCQFLRITNKRQPIINKYNIHNTILCEFSSAKYLGITIDSSINWRDNTNNVYKKASFLLSFLERNFHKCPQNVKENLFNALVRPILEYGCCAWDPYRICQIEKLELINKRAARFITGNNIREHGNSRKNMMSLGWSPLSERRAKIKLIMFHKIINKQIHIPTDDLIPNRRKPLNYCIPQSTVDSHLYSFYQSTIRLWNSHPNSTSTLFPHDLYT